jgi:hypothetical protein
MTAAALVHLNGVTKYWNPGSKPTRVTDAGLTHLKGVS